MTCISINGVKLHVEDIGTGDPIIFAHEFGGDTRSWQPQVEHFSSRYRCITFNARGYPPSDVPEDAVIVEPVPDAEIEGHDLLTVRLNPPPHVLSHPVNLAAALPVPRT